MNAEDDTREIPLDEPEEDGETQPEPDLGPWGAEAVRLGEQSRDRAPIGDGDRRAEATPRRRIALAAVVCAASVFSALGALILGGGSTAEKRQPPIAEQTPNETRAAHRARQRRRQVRRQASRRHSTAQPHATRPAPSPTYLPTPVPAPAPEPVTPSPAPAPAPEPPPTTKPQPASGAAVAKEFGFER